MEFIPEDANIGFQFMDLCVMECRVSGVFLRIYGFVENSVHRTRKRRNGPDEKVFSHVRTITIFGPAIADAFRSDTPTENVVERILLFRLGASLRGIQLWAKAAMNQCYSFLDDARCR